MDEALTSLIAASVTCVGTHFALSHPLRAALVKALGPMGFMALYSIAALASFGWMAVAFRAIGAGGSPVWNGSGAAVWMLASLLTLVALTLFLGAFRGNPALRALTSAAHPTGTPKAKGRSQPAHAPSRACVHSHYWATTSPLITCRLPTPSC